MSCYRAIFQSVLVFSFTFMSAGSVLSQSCTSESRKMAAVLPTSERYAIFHDQLKEVMLIKQLSHTQKIIVRNTLNLIRVIDDSSLGPAAFLDQLLELEKAVVIHFDSQPAIKDLFYNKDSARVAESVSNFELSESELKVAQETCSCWSGPSGARCTSAETCASGGCKKDIWAGGCGFLGSTWICDGLCVTNEAVLDKHLTTF